VITNLFEEHIPWHGSVVRYWLDKAKIFSLGAEHLVCDQATLTKLHEIGNGPHRSELSTHSTAATRYLNVAS
jgi:UDP-N-acetylmuramoylalanine-D-glutamate ligase